MLPPQVFESGLEELAPEVGTGGRPPQRGGIQSEWVGEAGAAQLGRGDVRLSLGLSGFYTHSGHREDCPEIGPECSAAAPPDAE